MLRAVEDAVRLACLLHPGFMVEIVIIVEAIGVGSDHVRLHHYSSMPGLHMLWDACKWRPW